MKNVIEALIVTANNAIFQAKHALTSHNTSPDVSLAERWKAFAEAPDYLKEHDSWILHFTFPDGTEFEVDGYDRHMTKNMVDVIEGIQENEYYENNPDSDGVESYDDIPDSKNVIAFKEFILERNLGSFCVDW
jgi:hypothetical protein